jgi:biopolymer transport protein ExbB
MDRVIHNCRKTTIVGSAVATALFLAIATSASTAQTAATPAPAALAAAPDSTAAAPPAGTPAPTGDASTSPAPTDATGQPTTEAAPDAGETAVAAPEAPTENPYSLMSLVKNGDWVARGALIILFLMSAGTWFILFTKYFDQQGLLSAAKAANRIFWSASTPEDGAGRLARSSPFRAVAEDGIEAANQHSGALASEVSLNDWVAMALQRSVSSVNQRLQGGLPFLATVGSTAPFVGLFGTVWGIYHALIAIGLAGQASIDKVAGPVGEALIMTAIGLGVAVPAVFFYNFLVARNKNGMELVRDFAADLQTYLVGGGRGHH